MFKRPLSINGREVQVFSYEMLRVVAFCLIKYCKKLFLIQSAHPYTSANIQALMQNSLQNWVNRKAFSPLPPHGHVGAALSHNTVNMFIRCCFLVHYWFCCLCTLPSLKCILLKISSTSFELYQLNKFWLTCLSVCMWIGFLVISKHDISIYIIIKYFGTFMNV